MTQKNFQDKKCSHELFLTKPHKAKDRNAFANNILTDIELSKAELSKIIQFGGFLVNIIGNLDKKH